MKNLMIEHQFMMALSLKVSRAILTPHSIQVC